MDKTLDNDRKKAKQHTVHKFVGYTHANDSIIFLLHSFYTIGVSVCTKFQNSNYYKIKKIQLRTTKEYNGIAK